MSAYFSYFPNVYVGEGITSEENFKYRLVKNIFRRVKAREDLDRYTTLFEAYSIKPNETPSSLAYRLFGDSYLDWVILITNNIIDVYDQWPKSEERLQNYVNELYSSPESVHHYETNEILYNGITYVQKGIEVTEEFRVTMPDGTTLSETESIYPVTNYEHEYYLNEKKRLIAVPQGTMVDLILAEMEDQISYKPHGELDDAGNKKTPINISSLFIKNSSSSNTNNISSSSGEIVTSFNYGPDTASVSTAGVVIQTNVLS